MYARKDSPLITCLLVTAKHRFDLVKRSIQCFVDQTYKNKELLIVNEGPREYQHQIQVYVENLQRNDIRWVWLQGEYTLGGLRNIAVGLARGEIFVQWDDDDLSMPQRLATQYAYLSKSKAKICWLTDQLHYYWPTQTLYWDNWKKYHNGGIRHNFLIPGTIMAFKDLQVRYPSVGDTCRAGEDTDFANDILRKYDKQVALLEGVGFMQVYTFHGNQVYDFEHHIAISRMRAETKDHMLHYRQRIVDAIEYLQLGEHVKVMSKDGLAFIHERRANDSTS